MSATSPSPFLAPRGRRRAPDFERHAAIVSNAGPGVLKLVNGTPHFEFKAGGVAAVLLPAADDLARTFERVVWFYAESTELGKQYQGQVFRHGNFDVCPVYIPPEIYDPYYNHIANSRDWFVHHGHGHRLSEDEQNEHWEAKKEANEIFAKTVDEMMPEGSFIFGNDYQPDLSFGMLATRRPDLDIVGFFHIPFARPEELERRMPRDHAEFMMEQMAKVPWVFQTRESEEHYLACVERFLGKGKRFGARRLQGLANNARARTAPVVIDWDAVHEKAKAREVWEHMERMLHEIGDPERPVIVEVARTDETKCILETLEAYEQVVQMKDVNPKPVLVLVSNPSRLDSPRYAQYRADVEAKIDQINATVPGAKVMLQKGNEPGKADAPFEVTLAAFRIGDVFAHGARRAGFEVVAVEFQAAKQWGDKLGLEVLFEGIGAAETMAGVKAEQTRFLDPRGRPILDENGKWVQLIEGRGTVNAAYIVRGGGPEVRDAKAIDNYAAQLKEAVVLSGKARELRALATYAAARPQNGALFLSTLRNFVVKDNPLVLQEGYLSDASSADLPSGQCRHVRATRPAMGGAGQAIGL